MKKFNENQSGRSMIEMLGVLAIVGVLSVAGIAGYSKAMAKYKINKVMDEVSTIAANTKTMFAANGTYEELTDAIVGYSLGLFPEEMTKSCTPDATTGAISESSCIINGLGGAVTLATTDANGKSFTLTMEGLTSEACVALVTSDWGGAAGFRSVTPNYNASATEANPNQSVTPATSAAGAFEIAANKCLGAGSVHKVQWIFY